MGALTDWLKNHQLLYPFILFLLSAAFSLYSKDIRRFLHEWPRTKEKARQAQRDKAARRLALLKLLHNDSYQLLLYFASRFVSVIFAWLIWVAFFTVIAVFRKTTAPVDVFVGILGGLFMGMFQEIRGVLVQLTRYDESVAALQKKAEITLSAPGTDAR